MAGRIAVAGVRPLDAVHFVGMRGRQDDVGQLARRRHVQVHVHEEVQVLEAFDDLVAALDGEDGLGRLLPVPVDLERIALRHGLRRGRAEAALLAVDDLAAGVLLRGLQLAGGVVGHEDVLVAGVLAHGQLLDVHGRFLAALPHAALLVRHDVEHEGVVAGGGLAADVLAALRVEVAGQRHHDGERLRDAGRVDGELHLLAAREARVRAGVDVGVDGFLDLALGKLAELGGALDGPRGDVLHQDVPAGAVRLAVDLVAAGQRGLRVGHDVALGVEPLEGLRAAHALRVLPVAGPEDQLVAVLVPRGVQLLVAVLLEVRLAQLVARAVAVGVLLVDEERGVRVHARELGGAFVRLDDLVDERQHQRHVGARTDGQPDVGLGGGAGETRVDADDLRAALLRALDGEPVVVAAAALLAAPDEDAVGVVAVPAGVLRLVAVQTLAGEVRAHPAQVAHAERGRRAQLKPQLVDGLELQHVAARAVLVRDGVPTVLLADLGEAVARFLVGLFPRDALPLAGALLAHALLRVAHAQRVVQLLRDGEAAPAQRALAEEVGVALDLHEAPVLDVPEQRAAAVALAARAGDDLHVIGRGAGGRCLVGRGGGRRRAEQQRRSGRDGRSLHEASAAHL